MKKIAKTLLMTFLLIIAITIMPSSVYAEIAIEGYKADEASIAEQTVTDLFLGIGDFFFNMINEIVGENVSLQKLVFNNIVALDPNFFNTDLSTTNEVTSIMRDQINKWYSFFSALAITVYLIVLLCMGIKVVLGSTAGGLQKLKELAVKWLVRNNVIIFIS